jgi:hypothetical protein
MTRYPTGIVGSIVFMRGEDVVGRYRVSEKAVLIVSASSVLYENTEALGGLTEYVEGRRADIDLYANGEIELLLTDRSYTTHTLDIKTDRVIELFTDVSKRIEVARDIRVYVFGRRIVFTIYPTELGYLIHPYRNKDAYTFLKPLIEKIREKHAIEI